MVVVVMVAMMVVSQAVVDVVVMGQEKKMKDEQRHTLLTTCELARNCEQRVSFLLSPTTQAMVCVVVGGTTYHTIPYQLEDHVFCG